MRYHDITHDDMLNGDGLRVVLWVAGCEHKCKGCHNPSTWDIGNGIEFDLCAKKEIFNELKKDYIKGITFTGGDPLHPKNREMISLLAREVKMICPNKDIWLYTGYKWEEVCDLDWIKYINILVDGKFQKDLADTSLEYKGSSNQRIIDVRRSLAENKIIIKE